jgi:hypothetical protein
LEAVPVSLETFIRQVATNKQVAWWPGRDPYIVTHPGGRTWVSKVNNYLGIFTLEGATANPEEGPTPQPGSSSENERGTRTVPSL